MSAPHFASICFTCRYGTSDVGAAVRRICVTLFLSICGPAGTMRSVAAALSSGEAVYLDGVRSKTHFATLISQLHRGKTDRNTKLLADRGELGVWDRYRAVEDLDNRPLVIEDADYVSYPTPTIYKRHLAEAISQAANRNGVKQRARQMKKWLATGDDFVPFTEPYEIEALADFCSRCKAARIDVEWIERAMEDYGRLHRANVHTLPELRMALRELVPQEANHEHERRDPERRSLLAYL